MCRLPLETWPMSDDMPNADEISYWNDEAGSRWAELQGRIDRAFEPLGRAGLAAAAAQSGESVLDIGCGCGASSLELGRAVTTTGIVTGIDVSRPMLAVAETRAQASGLTNVRFQLADASTHAFGGHAFDVGFSRFGVMFFEDPVGAFVNVRRALRSGGRLAFVCWRELAANPWFFVPVEAIRPHVPAQPKLDPDAPGPLAFADPNRVRAILQHAGFVDVRCDAFDARLPIGGQHAAVELVSRIGPASRLLAGGSDGERADALHALDEALAVHLIDGEVQLGAGVWIVTARAR